MSDSRARAVRGGGTEGGGREAEKGEVWGIAAEGKLKMLEAFLIVKSFVL